MCKSMNTCGCAGSKILWALVIIGALNWGFVGAFDVDLVQVVFGSIAWIATLIYILVGLAGLMLLLGGCRCRACKSCTGGSCGGPNKKSGGCCGGSCHRHTDEVTK